MSLIINIEILFQCLQSLNQFGLCYTVKMFIGICVLYSTGAMKEVPIGELSFASADYNMQNATFLDMVGSNICILNRNGMH